MLVVRRMSARGATSRPPAASASRRRFNPRAREGRDQPIVIMRVADAMFQSTRPRGARLSELGSLAKAEEFQSTRPRGARRSSPARPTRSSARFNPRAREGRDAIADYLNGLSIGVSIHAPARGATISARGCIRRGGSFNPRAREGRDPLVLTQSFAANTFQSTRPRGARHRSAHRRHAVQAVSIHAPARGATIESAV